VSADDLSIGTTGTIEINGTVRIVSLVPMVPAVPTVPVVSE
jgi:hypothetical protein